MDPLCICGIVVVIVFALNLHRAVISLYATISMDSYIYICSVKRTKTLDFSRNNASNRLGIFFKNGCLKKQIVFVFFFLNVTINVPAPPLTLVRSKGGKQMTRSLQIQLVLEIASVRISATQWWDQIYPCFSTKEKKQLPRC